MTSATIREQVANRAGRYARSHPSIVEGVTDAIERDGIRGGQDFLRNAGYGSYAYMLDGITVESDASVGQATVSVDAFDRATAAEVIRAFVQSDQPHLGGVGYQPDEVTALLVLAGLEDEPEPVVEAEEEVDLAGLSRLVHSLVAFARGHGFRG